MTPPSNVDRRTTAEIEREAFLKHADEAARPGRELNALSRRVEQALYSPDTFTTAAHDGAYLAGGVASEPSRRDRLGWTDAQVAADRAELLTLQQATGLNLARFIDLEAEERMRVHERTLRGQPADDVQERTHLLARTRTQLRDQFGAETDALLARVDQFLAAHPTLKTRIATGNLRGRYDVLEDLVAHVVRTKFGATPAGA